MNFYNFNYIFIKLFSIIIKIFNLLKNSVFLLNILKNRSFKENKIILFIKIIPEENNE